MGKINYSIDLNDLPQELQSLYDFIIDDIMTEYMKYYHQNNKAAGVRLRKNTMTLKKFASNLREQVRNSLNNDNES
ncbi:MAG: hypothetical protein KDH96_04665 [Candidatus Riesia sp.]|nr:hypothetical protein [Candidatus Riesia sp.]